MKKFKLGSQIFFTSFAISVFSLLIVTWYATETGRELYLQKTAEGLNDDAYLIKEMLLSDSLDINGNSIQKTISQVGKYVSIRITLIKPNGQVIADSEHDPYYMDNHATRPEFLQALKSKTGQSVRYSHTVEREMIYFALYLDDFDNHGLIIRTSKALSTIEQVISTMQFRIFKGGLFVSFLAILAGFIISRRISTPLERIIGGVREFAGGNLTKRLSEPSTEEMADLSEALNKMAIQLDDKIQTIVRQRNQQKAVFESMAEGVIAVDKNMKIITANSAAYKLFGIKDIELKGRYIRDVFKNAEMDNLVLDVLRTGMPREEEITLVNQSELCLIIKARVLSDESSETIGASLVINDLTRLRILEANRREFVANVSHELRTPLTSIKGFAEALHEGGIEDHETTRRFIDIIYRQSNRLGTILEDILTLSRLDREETNDIEFTEENVKNVIDAAVQICSFNADKKRIPIQVHCDDQLTVTMSAQLIEEALINLIDNAVKYSPEEREINVNCTVENKNLLIKVTDKGNGINQEHLARIFERFYRVDKARSRDMGGTGLGLAIVKHIALVHNGYVEVESTPGQGSIFSLFLPMRLS